MNRILLGDVLSFARHYKGEPFHALICDAPYHLTSITDRFGKEDSIPAQEGNDGAFKRLSTGFMGKSWDGGDIAFRPETWRAFWDLLYPGAFGMTFGGSRTSHRMAVAIEDAGFIIHPIIGWAYGSGFPKATRVEKQCQKQRGVKRGWKGNAISNEGMLTLSLKERLHWYKEEKKFSGRAYGLQVQKPALEPIIVFQKPYEGRPVDDITRTGAGALNIDGGRIGDAPPSVPQPEFDSPTGHIYQMKTGHGRNGEMSQSTQGRWPANFIIQHSPDCMQVGTSPDGYTINRFTDGAKPFGDAVGEKFEGEQIEGESAVWQCVDGCPARELDRQSGHLKSGLLTPEHKSGNWGWHKGNRELVTLQNTYGDSGGASRFFFNADYAYENLENAAPFMYQAKAGKRERNAGLHHLEISNDNRENAALTHAEDRQGSSQNPHPTIKPISLIKHLATLLLPPDEYAPRRIFIPFCGTGSEIIGSFQAGWECVIGVEKEAEYVDIAKPRIDYWEKQGIQLPMFDE